MGSAAQDVGSAQDGNSVLVSFPLVPQNFDLTTGGSTQSHDSRQPRYVCVEQHRMLGERSAWWDASVAPSRTSLGWSAPTPRCTAVKLPTVRLATDQEDSLLMRTPKQGSAQPPDHKNRWLARQRMLLPLPDGRLRPWLKTPWLYRSRHGGTDPCKSGYTDFKVEHEVKSPIGQYALSARQSRLALIVPDALHVWRKR